MKSCGLIQSLFKLEVLFLLGHENYLQIERVSTYGCLPLVWKREKERDRRERASGCLPLVSSSLPPPSPPYRGLLFGCPLAGVRHHINVSLLSFGGLAKVFRFEASSRFPAKFGLRVK